MKCWFCDKEEMKPVEGTDYLQCPGCGATHCESPALAKNQSLDTGFRYARAKDTPGTKSWLKRR